MELQQQRVVVIGGTSGIGLAVSRAAIGAGAEVVIASSRQASVDAALTQLGTSASGQAVDVLDPSDVAAFFDSLAGVDHLVYTAGDALSLMAINDLALRLARSFFEVRYFGALNCVHAALPQLRAGGSVTLTSGSAAERPGPGWALAASVCGAMNSLTKALAVELAPIRVNAVAPGVVRSPLWSQLSESDRDAMYNQVGQSLPVGRVGGVDDIAQAYLYCMTQGYGTGTVIEVDGGALLV
ncbi:MAG: short-chain dehydrogenase/reductase [Frankiales bacterium]|nr:short-chain dehydrogenase/reductase [Frankiales bacterium]